MDKGRTDSTESTDKLALKREQGGGRLKAQNYKKIELKNYKDLKVQKCRSASCEAEIQQILSKSSKLLKLKKTIKTPLLLSAAYGLIATSLVCA